MYNEIHNTNLEPRYPTNYEIALKNYVLFSQLDNKNIIVISKKYLINSLDFIAKYDL